MKSEKNKKPELVCPAGDWSGLITAVECGADSMYFGVRGLNMRANAANFDLLELRKLMRYLHDRGKKGYLALNVVVMNNEIPKIRRILEEAAGAGIDAVILWDMAVLSIARDMNLNVHISTQASISNYESLKFYSGLGAKRAVLARELSLDDIREMTGLLRREGLETEVETFVHGAMCVSISGRCFLSSHSWGKSANRGECRQPCRREYEIRDSSGEAEYIVGRDYLLSPEDLCTIMFLDELIEAGVHSFKIEGRMRPPEYTQVVVSAYRKAIDLYFSGKLDDGAKKELYDSLTRVYNRGFSSGFYFKRPEIRATGELKHRNEKLYLGEVTRYFPKLKVAEILIRSNGVKKGDRLFITGKNTPAGFADAVEIQQERRFVETADKGESAGIRVPFRVRKGDHVFLWKEKNKT